MTSHAVVLAILRDHPTLRMEDIAAAGGLTARTVLVVVKDLERAGYVTRSREGRRNRYLVHPDLPMRPALASTLQAERFFELLDLAGSERSKSVRRSRRSQQTPAHVRERK